MDPQTVLRFIKTIGGSPGQGDRGRLRARRGGGDGAWPLARGARRPSGAPSTSSSTRSPSFRRTPPTRTRGGPDARALDRAGGRRHRDPATPAGGAVKLVSLRLGTMRQVVPDSLDFYFGIVARDTLCEGAELEHELVERPPALPAAAAANGIRRRRRSPRHEPVGTELAAPDVPVRRIARRPGEVEAGGELEVESIEVEDAEGARHLRRRGCTARRSGSPRTRSTPTRRSRAPTATTSTAPTSACST